MPADATATSFISPLFVTALSIVFLSEKVGMRRWIATAIGLIGVLVAGFLLVNKVWSPQYSLWFVVPAVLALPYWRLLLSWMVVDMAVWPVLMWHMMGTDNLGVPGWFLNIVIIARDALIITIMVLVVRQVLGKRRDKVRAAHNGHDPLMSLPYQWKEPLPIDAPSVAPAANPANAEQPEPAGSTAVKA